MESIHVVKSCSVVGAKIISWDGEGENGCIWATHVGTTASIPDTVLCRATCKDMGPGAPGIAILHHF